MSSVSSSSSPAIAIAKAKSLERMFQDLLSCDALPVSMRVFLALVVVPTYCRLRLNLAWPSDVRSVHDSLKSVVQTFWFPTWAPYAATHLIPIPDWSSLDANAAATRIGKLHQQFLFGRLSSVRDLFVFVFVLRPIPPCV
jgi:hypothetical protein